MPEKTFTESLTENLDKVQNIQTELANGVSPGRLHELVEQQGEVLLWLLGAMVEHQSSTSTAQPASTVGL